MAGTPKALKDFETTVLILGRIKLNNPTVTLKQLCEWSTAPINAPADEVVIYIAPLTVYASFPKECDRRTEENKTDPFEKHWQGVWKNQIGNSSENDLKAVCAAIFTAGQRTI